MSVEAIDNSMDESVRDLGNYWAAIRDDEVVAVMSMRVPNDVDFQDYQNKVYEALKCVSETVKRGYIVETDEGRVFVQRANHANRSKNADPSKRKPPKVYRMARHLS